MPDRDFRILIEGIGHVVQSFYWQPLKKAREENSAKLNITITFVDESDFWSKTGDTATIDRNKKFIESINKWAEYIDKSTAAGKEEYKKLSADVVFIATPDFTHVELAWNWLKDPNRCQKIFIEKPLDSSLDRVQEFLGKTIQFDSKVRAFDHYLARAIPVIGYSSEKFLKDLGGSFQNFSFYFLENGSGGGKVGPIEKDGRASTLKNGIILDLMPHVPAILNLFLRIDSTRVIGVRAGRYTFTENGKVKEAAIPKETFAHIKVELEHHSATRKEKIKGDIYVGKAIRGVKALGMEGDVKVLELVGKNSQKIRFYFGNSGELRLGVYHFDKNDHLKREDPLVELIPKPYEAIISRIVRQQLEQPGLKLRYDLPLETAYRVLEIVERMRFPLKKRKTDKIPTYHIGKGGKEAPYLEDLIHGDDALPVIYGAI